MAKKDCSQPRKIVKDLPRNPKPVIYPLNDCRLSREWGPLPVAADFPRASTKEFGVHSQVHRNRTFFCDTFDVTLIGMVPAMVVELI